jgi:hypothetical protein
VCGFALQKRRRASALQKKLQIFLQETEFFGDFMLTMGRGGFITEFGVNSLQ